ncbi:MAG: nickel pincer cofactor biosynthesis protein LarC [Coriobacteriales bacterium]|jgi:uncharacterized protein (TIGR00299 family) protein|nr:nickel pincer cofactor biosynthesis protein LarC [Coriobacteriales bacterium]
MGLLLHLDLSTGASGDKLLGALLEVCERQGLVAFDELMDTARELLPGVDLTHEHVVRGGIAATHITVEEHTGEDAQEQEHTASFDEVEGRSHKHKHLGHRNWKDIHSLIEDAADRGVLSPATAELATRAFTRIAEAEATVHGVAPDEVHFHEVGAADSIMDVVLNSFLLLRLKPEAVYATPLALGNGSFVCEHGELPVPAPATAEILALSEVPVYASSHEGELTTPTGAALIAEFVSSFAPLPCSLPRALGFGAGSREIAGAANVLRAISAEPAPLAGLTEQADGQFFVEGVVQLECNLDHLSAEAIAFACEELLAAGALDVWQEPIVMKKGRLATKLVMLAPPERATGFAEKIIELTGTLGVRSSYLERTVIPRAVLTLDTPYGPVPFKAAEAGPPSKRSQWLRPEHDAVARLARERSLSYADLYAELQEYAEGHQQARGE